LVLDVEVALGDRAQNNPVLLVACRDGLAIVVDLIDFVELLIAANGAPKVLGNFPGVSIRGVESQFSKLGQRVLEVAVIHKLSRLLPRVARRRGRSQPLESGYRGQRQQQGG
jgi:hypothetical protein